MCETGPLSDDGGRLDQDCHERHVISAMDKPGTLVPHNVLNVETPAGVCRVSLDYRKNGAGIPEIGPLRYIKELAP